MGLLLSSQKKRMLTSNNGVTLSYISCKCPHLLGVSIRNTTLNVFGTDIQFKNSIRVAGNLTIRDSMIQSPFLPSLSNYVSYIDKFSISSCEITGTASKNPKREIDTANTTLGTVLYEANIPLSKVYLEFSTSISSWYVSEDSRFVACAEREYLNSLGNKRVLSVMIKCKTLSTVQIRLCRVNAILSL